MPWSPHRPTELERKVETLSLKLLRANAALCQKQIYCERLEFLLHQRSEKIDELTGTIDQLRLKIRLLGQEDGHLAAMLAPKYDAVSTVETVTRRLEWRRVPSSVWLG